MTVHKRAYRPYDGPLTPERHRFLVVARYGLLQVFESRLLIAFLALAFVPFLFEAGFVYVANSPSVMTLLGMSPAEVVPPIRRDFFLAALTFQGMLAFLLTAWVSPALVSPDLVNGALPLYLSRPLSRGEYVAGKAAVLATLLSLITWLPGLLLFGLQAGLAGTEWSAANLRVAWGIFAGAWTWITVLTLLGLALSAWIRWRIVASAGLFAIFFGGSAFGEAWREVMQDPWGRLTNLSYLIGIVWRSLFDVGRGQSVARFLLGDRQGPDIPLWAAWTSLAALCAFCLLILDRRLQAREVVS